MTKGTLAIVNNQPSYDVISGSGKKISVKTATTSNHVNIKASTIEKADSIIVVRIDVTEDEGISINIVHDLTVDEVMSTRKLKKDGNYSLSTTSSYNSKPIEENFAVVEQAIWKEFTISQYENLTIKVYKNDIGVEPAKPQLRQIAHELSVGILNSNGNPKNTRTLGSEIIRTFQARDQE